MPSSVIIFLRGVLGYCPHCGKRRMFRGVYALHPRCPVCGLQFENKPGDFTGAAYLNSGITGFIGVMIGLGGVLFTQLSVMTILLITIPLITLIAVLLHQPIKGSWIALMYYTGAIQAPRPNDPVG